MQEIDVFASELFEEAKRFLEKAKEPCDGDGKRAFLHTALLLGICSLEAHINSICDEMSERKGLNLLDLSILQEKEINFEQGEYKLTARLKIYNLIDRIAYLERHFDRTASWWSKLNEGIELRNSLVHPKAKRDITYEQVERAFDGILSLLDSLYMVIYEKRFPALGRGLNSRMGF